MNPLPDDLEGLSKLGGLIISQLGAFVGGWQEPTLVWLGSILLANLLHCMENLVC